MTHAELERERECDSDAYQEMAAQYRRLCADHPQNSRFLIARDVGCKAFNISLADLLSGTRSPPISRPRMKIMACAAALVGDSNYPSLARAFHRRAHSTIWHAATMYGSDVRRALAIT